MFEARHSTKPVVKEFALEALSVLFPSIRPLYNSHPAFVEALLSRDLRESLAATAGENDYELLNVILNVAADPAVGPSRVLAKDEQGRYAVIEKMKQFASRGLADYVRYAVQFPEGTDVVLKSPKFERLLKEGESALREFGARGEGAPTILSVLPDIFAVSQVATPQEREGIIKLFEGDDIYAMSALDIPYFVENHVVYPQATELAIKHGQLNRYYIEQINQGLAADSLQRRFKDWNTAFTANNFLIL